MSKGKFPLIHLYVFYSEEVLNILTKLNENGQNILMVTHDIKAAIHGSRILYLEDGMILDELFLDSYKEDEARVRESKVNNWISGSFSISLTRADRSERLETHTVRSPKPTCCICSFIYVFEFNHQDNVEIKSGEIYISPAMISMFDVQIGDKITFPIARSGKNIIFTVKGFYEDQNIERSEAALI